MKRAMLLIALSFLPLTAHSESTAEMLSNCRPIAQAKVTSEGISFEQSYSAGLCWGAFATFQGVSKYVNKRRIPVLHYCPPKGARRGQHIAVFVKYAEDNPQRRHEDFDIVATDAFVEAYPCTK